MAKGAKLSGWPRLSFLDLAKKLMCAFVNAGLIYILSCYQELCFRKGGTRLVFFNPDEKAGSVTKAKSI